MDFEVVATGYCFLEAPRAVGADLWFTDLLLGGVHRLSPDGTVTRFLPERLHAGGLAVNDDGKIICGGPGGLTWLDPETGASGIVFDTVDGEPFIGANDFISDGKGGLYLGTLSKGADYSKEPELTRLYHVDAECRVRLVSDELKFSNGVGMSPDGGRLYHNESLRGVFVYDIQPDGTLANKAVFHPREDGDGLAVDAEGGVWIAHMDGYELCRYLPDGTLDRTIRFAHKIVSSVAFGGPDWRDIYVTTGGDHGVESLFTGELPPREASVFKARSDVAGMPVAPTRFKLPVPA